jgi:hypothetical protein
VTLIAPGWSSAYAPIAEVAATGGCGGRDDDKAFPRSENHLLSLDHAGRVAYLEPFEERGARGAHSCSSSSTTRTWRLSGVM